MKFKIGDKTITYASCDDSTAAKGSWDAQTCTNNANALQVGQEPARHHRHVQLGLRRDHRADRQPRTGRRHRRWSAPPTRTSASRRRAASPGEPSKYFPSGKRNYARVAVPDNFQGAADATFLQQKGIKSVYVLNDGEAYGAGIANNFVNAAKALGITVLGNDKWDANQPDYQSLFQTIASKNPQAVFLGGIVSLHGGQLIKDKVKVLGDNNKVLLLGPDGFNDSATVTDAGAAAEGMYVTIGGHDPNALTNATGKAFIAAYKKTYKVDHLEAYTAYGAQAFLVLANAITKSDGTRASITKNLYNQSFPKGIIGSFKIDSIGRSVARRRHRRPVRGRPEQDHHRHQPAGRPGRQGARLTTQANDGERPEEREDGVRQHGTSAHPRARSAPARAGERGPRPRAAGLRRALARSRTSCASRSSSCSCSSPASRTARSTRSWRSATRSSTASSS